MTVLFADDFSSPSTRARRVAAGTIAPIARGVWTDETTRPREAVVAQSWVEIVGRLLPGAVISDRSAFALRPIDGTLFVSHSSRTPLVLPGLTVYPDGSDSPRRPDDVPMDTAGRLFGSSRTRALIDNAEQRGRPARIRRKLSRSELHDHVARIVASSTTHQVDQLLLAVAADANATAAGAITAVVNAARGTGPAVATTSRALSAAQRGETYDHSRVALFAAVASELERAHLVDRLVVDVARARYVPFYEAYFSNYIEGSTLTVGEAERVIFEDADVGKPVDAHDIRATWEIVSDEGEMGRVPTTSSEFLDMLRDRHRAMMAAHPRALPGQWKNRPNQAGATTFVAPDHVVGTLRAGWEEGQAISDPFQRAVYAMFLVSEVHPFIDGNGRSARVAMNSELVPHRSHRVVVPTILRGDYLSALGRATAGNGIAGLYRVLERAQLWVARGEFGDLATADRYLRVTRATTDSDVAAAEGVGLGILRIGELAEREDPGHPPPPRGGARSALDVVAFAHSLDRDR